MKEDRAKGVRFWLRGVESKAAGPTTIRHAISEPRNDLRYEHQQQFRKISPNHGSRWRGNGETSPLDSIPWNRSKAVRSRRKLRPNLEVGRGKTSIDDYFINVTEDTFFRSQVCFFSVYGFIALSFLVMHSGRYRLISWYTRHNYN